MTKKNNTISNIIKSTDYIDVIMFFGALIGLNIITIIVEFEGITRVQYMVLVILSIFFMAIAIASVLSIFNINKVRL